jgi:hypothetical protein
MGMTDQTLVDKLLTMFTLNTTAFTITPGTGGGSAFTFTPPLHLRLFATTGSEATTGTEQTGTNGYTTGGSTMGTTAFAAWSAGASSNANQVQWTASGTWASATNGIEIWDTSGTPVRLFWGALTSAIAANAVVNLDTVTFAAGSITTNASAW